MYLPALRSQLSQTKNSLLKCSLTVVALIVSNRSRERPAHAQQGEWLKLIPVLFQRNLDSLCSCPYVEFAEYLPQRRLYCSL